MARKMSPNMPSNHNQLPDSESDSDSEGEDQDPEVGAAGPWGVRSLIQVIHSGHFMVSSPHSDPTPRRRKSGSGYDFDTVNRTWCQTYRFGPLSSGSLSIDPTLNRLFECMSLAYSGKIVSPKWKKFKGLRLLWRDKIRLNNAIWRAWYIQYLEKRRNPVCGFVTPLDGTEADSHRKPEAIVLEGSYWKRRIEVVIKEYHKWRIYYKKRLQRNKDDFFSMLQQDQLYRSELEKWSNQIYQEPEAAPEEAHMFDLDCFLSNTSDTLFTMTQKPCAWAGDRHGAYSSNADMIQPALTPLQPNLDDFMDIPDIFMNYRLESSDHSGFADFGYLDGPSGGAFTPVSTHQLLAETAQHKLAQPGEALGGPLPQVVSPTAQPEQARSGGHCPPYQFPALLPTSGPYGQLYPDPPPTDHVLPLPSSATPFLYPPHLPLPSHRYSPLPHLGAAPTSTVITHTHASAPPCSPLSDTQPHGGDLYLRTPCRYPPAGAMMSAQDSAQHGLPPLAAAVSQCLPQGPGPARGKHKQKTGEARGAGPPSSGPFVPPPSSADSCLAKLLCASSHHGARARKPHVGSDSTWAAAKGQKTHFLPSTSSLRGADATSQQRPLATWPVGARTPLRPEPRQTPPVPGPVRPQASTSRGPLGSPRPPQNAASSTLLVPKTETLSPVAGHSPDRVPFTGQQSPSASLDPNPRPESFHSFSPHGKMEPKQTESRRITHISAEQKRRFNIKMGFDTLHNLVTTLSSQPSMKISKATTLHKTGEYISKMQQERSQLHDETQRLREEIQLLNSAINVCQQQLPATGAPLTSQRSHHMRQRFREYVQEHTLQDWRFWIFSVIVEPLFQSFNGMVSTANMEDLCRTTLSWLDQHCSLPALRPMVLSSLRLLSTSTSILSDPSLLPEQAALAVTQGPGAAASPSLGEDRRLQPLRWENTHHM